MVNCSRRELWPGLFRTPIILAANPAYGTRIAVALLLEWLAAGMTIKEIVKEYPSLTEEAVRGTLEELAHSELLAPSENPSR